MSSLRRGMMIANLAQEKAQWDQILMNTDRAAWYLTDLEKVSPPIASKFQLSYFDQEAMNFLENSFELSNALGWQIYYSLASTFLSLFMSKTSVNGALDRGRMFLFSKNQFQEFLDISPDNWDKSSKSLLDLGAGDGHVTANIADFFYSVYATEASKPMRYRLSNRGYTVLDADTWHESNETFTLISAMNLLDRYFDPYDLLSKLHLLALRNECNVMLTLVLPMKQYVEFHPTFGNTVPDKRINLKSRTFEEQAEELVQGIFSESGFELVKWTRLPYLCEGDMNRAYYVLDDAIFLLKPVQLPTKYEEKTGSFCEPNTMDHAEQAQVHVHDLNGL